jgi:carboxypeptidase C (cathepsin A)
MLYIDQPLGVGFSFGTDNVDSTNSAAPLVYKLLQAFHAKFPEYQSRDFGIFTESYGGHYGPAFAKYILDQNEAISKGDIKGERINLVALGLNNAWIEPYDNYLGMIDFALNNTYKRLINQARAKRLYDDLDTKCRPQLQRCWMEETDFACQNAVVACKNAVEMPLTVFANFDVYDVRKSAAIGPQGRIPSFPPQTYEKYLQMPEIQSTIGASRRYNECPRNVQSKFLKTGDGL